MEGPPGDAHDVSNLARGTSAPTGYDFGVKLAIPGGRVVDLVEGELTIGRSDKNDIVLADPTVSPRHARIIKRGPRVILADLSSDNGTWVNGHLVLEPHRLTCDDRIEIGRVAIEVIETLTRVEPTMAPLPPFTPRDATEAQLLGQITAREPGSREVYADWLGDRGLVREAGFVRAQDELVQLTAGAPRRHEIAEDAAAFDARWRLQISRPEIERCAREFEFQCPKEWGALAPTKDPAVRFCSSCTKPVYYAATVAEARERAANRECVALDLTAVRRDNDLSAPYGRTCDACGFVAGTRGKPICMRCGAQMPSPPPMMMLGRVSIS